MMWHLSHENAAAWGLKAIPHVYGYCSLPRHCRYSHERSMMTSNLDSLGAVQGVSEAVALRELIFYLQRQFSIRFD